MIKYTGKCINIEDYSRFQLSNLTLPYSNKGSIRLNEPINIKFRIYLYLDILDIYFRYALGNRILQVTFKSLNYNPKAPAAVPTSGKLTKS